MNLPIRLSTAVLLIAGLAACASTPRGDRLTYQQELDRLEADCTAREGILVPTGAATTGRPATDYACRIRNATRLTN